MAVFLDMLNTLLRMERESERGVVSGGKWLLPLPIGEDTCNRVYPIT